MVRKRLMAWFLAVFVVGVASPSLLKAEVSEPIREAAQLIHDIDHNGQAFTLSIAALGGGGAIGLGTWLLHERPLSEGGAPSPILLANSILIVSTGVSQFVHGFMRLGERRASAAAAQRLFADSEATTKDYLAYLDYRAHQSESTRLVGAVVTTLQGLATFASGLELALTDHSDYRWLGWTLTGLGFVGTGVGAVHFFGDTRSRRELDKALESEGADVSVSFDIAPTMLGGPKGQAIPGLAAFGRF